MKHPSSWFVTLAHFLHKFSFQHCTSTDLSFKKFDPNPAQSKLTDFGWLDLSSKIQFEICHWSWKLGWIWHFLKKIWWFNSCHNVKHQRYFDKLHANLRQPSIITMSYQILKSAKCPDFLLKCQIEPSFQCQWQLSNIILKFKYTDPICVIINEFRVGSIL